MLTPRRPKLFVRYKNVSGDSKVSKFEIKKDALTVRFTDHTVYRYTNQTAGPENISKMKELALSGKGLGTFITANLKDRFLRKIR